MPIPATLPQVADGIRRVLAQQGPMEVTELIAALRGAGLELGAEPADMVEDLLLGDLPFVVAMDDDRYARLDVLLSGRTFSHRLSAAEVDLGFLDVVPDLDPLSMLIGDEDDPGYQRLVDGTGVQELLYGYDDEELAERGIPTGSDPEPESESVLLLERDTLRRLGLRAGDLVGVTVRPDGLELAPLGQPAPPDAHIAMLTAGLAVLGGGGPERLDTLTWLVCADHTGAFVGAVPPLRELLWGAGMIRDGDDVAPAGFDLTAWRLGERVDYLAEMYDLEPDEALAVLAITTLVKQEGPPEDSAGNGPELAALTRHLAEPAVAVAVLGETIGAGREGAEALARFAERADPLARRRARPGLRFLRGKALERLGAVLSAEQAYESALEIADFPPALIELARNANDRGDAERAMALLRRAGLPADDELMLAMAQFLRPQRNIGRNDPCWCGSGRKYKVCHRGRERSPLDERALWLYLKADAYLSEGPWRLDILAVAQIHAEHQGEPGAVYTSIMHPLVRDSVLFEGGAFAAFLKERGVLLPDDERLMGEQWLLVERSLWEVEDICVGSGFRARDLRTGDRVDVRDTAASRSVRTGMLLCTRFVPAGDTVRCPGGIEVVTFGAREVLLEVLDHDPDPADIVAVLAAQYAPPRLQNTEGEPIVVCAATLRTPDGTALAARLDATYEREEDEQVWREHVTTHGMERLRATIVLDGHEVRVDTNSEARMDRVLGVLQGFQPGLEVLDQSRTPAEDLREAMSRAPAGLAPSGLPDPNDPAVAALLEEFTAQYEQGWLEEQIPALAGLTPREAAADPTRRPDLIRLLESFGPGGPGQMNTTRVRAALGL